MKKWKLIVLISSILVVIAISITLILIFTNKPKNQDDGEYHYPSFQPQITNPTDVYLTLGERGITNLEIYNTAILSYGLNVLLDLVDTKLLAGITVTPEELLQHKINIYATYNGIKEAEVDLDSEEQQTTFREQMIRQGYVTEKAMDDAIYLDAMRSKFARSVLDKQMSEYVPTSEQPLYYTTAQIEKAISSLYPTELKGIYLSFRSEAEAKKLLKQFGIDPNKSTNGWVNLEGNKLSKEEVITTFINLYNYLHEANYTQEALPYLLQSDVSSISTTISKYLFTTATPIVANESNLTDSYTPLPKKYINGYYYLAISIEKKDVITTNEYIEKVTNKQSDEQIQAITKKLDDQTFISTLINAYLYENRSLSNIQIFDERLDNAYYSASQNALAVLTNTTAKYSLTTAESAEFVATVTFDGKTLGVTADELFNELVGRYGILVSIQYMNFYLFFNELYSKVYNFEKRTKLAEYDKMYESSVNYLKSELEAGNFADQGFDKNYGWENFIRDYFGVTDLSEALLLGDAYTVALNTFDEAQFQTENEVSRAIYEKMMEAYILEEASISDYQNYVDKYNPSEYENTILYQITKNFTEYFQVKATKLIAFVDANGDGKADELADSQNTIATTLVEALYYLAKNNPTSASKIMGTSSKDQLAKDILNGIQANKYPPISTLTGNGLNGRLQTLITIYNNAEIEDSVFGVYKKANIRLQLSADTTYTDASASEATAKVLKEVWNKILQEVLILDNGSISRFEYAAQANSAVTALEATGFDEAIHTVNGVFVDNNQVVQMAVTGAINATWYRYTENIKDLVPETERFINIVRYFLLSQLDEDSLTKEEQEFIAKYSPATYERNFLTNNVEDALDALLDDSRMQQIVYDLYLTNFDSQTFKFTNSQYLEDLKLFMATVYK